MKAFWGFNKTVFKEISEDFCHPTGVPMDWDGRRYGIPFAPIKILMSGVLVGALKELFF